MPEVIKRTLDRPPRLTHGSAGLALTEQMMVTGLTGPESGKSYAALSALAGQGVFRGAPHPSVPLVYVDSIAIDMKDTSKARAIVEYRPANSSGPAPPGAPAVTRFGASAQYEETNLDGQGNLIYVEHQVETTDEETGETFYDQVRQTPRISKQVPHPVLTMTRTETSSPAAKALQYVGTVNASSWNGGPSRTWLCVAIEGETADGGETFQVEYEFHFRPDTWDLEVVFVGDDGLPPPDLGPSGRKDINPYKLTNFGALGL